MKLSAWMLQKIGKYLNQQVEASQSYLCDFDRICYEVRPADVLLVQGRNRISKIIRNITESPWSHAALYIGRLHDIEDPQLREFIHYHYQGSPSEKLIIESFLGTGTIISPITRHQNEHIRICRPAGLTYKDAQLVISEASKSLGRTYDVRHILDLARFLTRSRFIPTRWRSSLFKVDSGKASEDICSAMIARAFDSINFPILPLIRVGDSQNFEVIRRNPKLFTPSDFDFSPYFNIIKYPIFPVADAPVYRNLPWRDEFISHDHIGVERTNKLKDD